MSIAKKSPSSTLHFPLPKGYKQTEAGVIPEDWEAVELGQIAGIGDGIHSTPIYSNNGEYFFINGNNLRSGKVLITDETKRVDHEQFKLHGRTLSDKSIFISINGTIGNLGLYDNEPIVLGKSAAYLNVGPDTSRLYTYNALQNKQVIRQFEDGLTGSTIRNLGLSTIRGTKIPLPPTKAEQEAIAEALSDADALIESLEQLIAKKRQIKQGAMQELLTGKKRLPGFSGEWEVKTLGRVATLSKGTQLHASEAVKDGKFAHLNGGITPSSYTDKSNTAGNTIAISEGGNSCGFVQFMAEPFWCGGHCYSVIPNGIDNRFLYHALKWRQTAIMGLRVGSGLPNVQKSGLLDFKIDIPRTHTEQTVIATILSDMDAEIAALETKLSKARQVKQGMMQELLTGKTRLV